MLCSNLNSYNMFVGNGILWQSSRLLHSPVLLCTVISLFVDLFLSLSAYFWPPKRKRGESPDPTLELTSFLNLLEHIFCFDRIRTVKTCFQNARFYDDVSVSCTNTESCLVQFFRFLSFCILFLSLSAYFWPPQRKVRGRRPIDARTDFLAQSAGAYRVVYVSLTFQQLRRVFRMRGSMTTCTSLVLGSCLARYTYFFSFLYHCFFGNSPLTTKQLCSLCALATFRQPPKHVSIRRLSMAM